MVAEATVTRNREFITAHPDIYTFPTWCAATEPECRTWVQAHL